VGLPLENLKNTAASQKKKRFGETKLNRKALNKSFTPYCSLTLSSLLSLPLSVCATAREASTAKLLTCARDTRRKESRRKRGKEKERKRVKRGG
jgi:hypothetical protein